MKKNRIALILIVLITIIIASLYGTFALISDQMDDNANADYTFVIGNISNQKIIVSSNETKTIDIHLTNPYDGALNYGVVYSLKEDYEINIGTLSTSTNKAQDIVNGKEDRTISIIIDNPTENDIEVFLSIVTGYINGGDLILKEDQKLITNTININNILNTNLDTSGANSPNITDTMIPIYFSEQDMLWHKADVNNTNEKYEWYNYNNKKWANVALVTKDSLKENQNLQPGDIIEQKDILAYLVWIPRFKYLVWDIERTNEQSNFSYNALTDGIDIVFEKEMSTTGTITCNEDNTCTGTNGEYYTHPAFKFEGKELTGFWIGKFETTGVSEEPTILPNYNSLTFLNIEEQFQTSRLLTTKDTYNLENSNLDSHISKDLEWSAVSYLTNSIYGICNGAKNGCRPVYKNNSLYYNTGVSAGLTEENSNFGTYSYLGEKLDEYGLPLDESNASMVSSTTGNVYGVYDMVGGAQEMVMLSSNKESEILKGIDAKYYNIFTTKPLLGELPYQSEITDITVDEIWVTRGGSTEEEKPTIFTWTIADGTSQTNTSFRIIIT